MIRAAPSDRSKERSRAPLPEERRIDIGPMYIGVAAGAWCQLRRSCAHRVNRASGHRAVTLVAQRVDIRHIQQPRVLRAVRGVASQASLRLHRCMLINERPARLRVALGADRILIGRGLQVVVSEGAVRIVAVRASHEAFIHLVVEGHIEGRLDVCVTSEAKHRLFGLEQDSLGSSLMHGVASKTAHVGLGMGRSKEVRMSSCVAVKAGGIDGFGAGCCGIEDFGLVAARLYMGSAGAVAALAGDTLAAMLQSQLGMRIGVEFLRLLSVAGGAGFRTNIVRWIDGRIWTGRYVFQMRLLLRLTSGANDMELPDQEQHYCHH